MQTDWSLDVLLSILLCTHFNFIPNLFKLDMNNCLYIILNTYQTNHDNKTIKVAQCSHISSMCISPSARFPNCRLVKSKLMPLVKQR